MNSVAFFDLEIDPTSGRIVDIGSIKGDGSTFHSNSVVDFINFLTGVRYICGHNIFNHDLKYLEDPLAQAGMNGLRFIDTLYLSPLLFPKEPYHALLKDDKLQTEELNNPLNDSMKARDLFFDEVAAFQQADNGLKEIYYSLLQDKREFSSFFLFLDFSVHHRQIETLIRKVFHGLICERANLTELISEYPIELAYCLALIQTNSRYSITPPWVLNNYPAVERVMFLLRNNPCHTGCVYCNDALDIHKGLKRFFGFDSYRTYAGEPLQEKAVQAAVNNKSLLAVFPTGGGKSITFQVPALMSGVNEKGLTVVISPLQSLMKDQVDNLEKAGITEAVTINGLLDPIERAKSLERVENGTASILYIAPESLRSKTIERLLLGRKVVRFVIDEAHCFSAWGQDFRVDYLYIGDFIRELQEKKNLKEPIPVSCFTATAKRNVIEDIKAYFHQKLGINLEVFRANASRTNLRYQVFEKATEEEKYNTVRDLIQEKNCPTIIYVSRTRKAYQLAQRLTRDGFEARPYHGKMDTREKMANQDVFIQGEVQVMVATSAFGMGVDKKDVGMVIHYDISDSLENYIQEAGRAGRDENITADCFVLFNDEDLSKHFVLLNQTKLSIREIQQVWKAIKDLTKLRSKVSQSALEIARRAGWDDSIAEIETRVTTAIAALEEAGYVKRGQNAPRVYADSILCRTAQEAISRINASSRFDDKQKETAARIISKLFSSRSRQRVDKEVAESRVDYIADHLGIEKQEVVRIVNLLREEKILADAKDLTAFIRKRENVNRSLNIVNFYGQLEKYLLTVIDDEGQVLSLKELNEEAEEFGCTGVTPNKIKTVLNFWAIKNWIRRQNTGFSRNHVAVMGLQPRESLEALLTKRNELARFIVEYLYEKSGEQLNSGISSGEEVPVQFSVLELKEAFENRSTLFKSTATLDEIEDALFYLSRIEGIKIEGGFLVTYQALTIERLERDNKRRYKQDDYKKLNEFYQNKIQQIHIVGEYARKMISNYKAALQFVDDYFQLDYKAFLNKYFPGSRQKEIKKNITPAKFQQLFGELSVKQLEIINDKDSKYIVVAAGPGSGKTRVLVHKLASLLLMEDVKHEQLLMLTFSRSAVTDFKKRLLKLIGNAANFIEIKTFHSYCFDLLGKVGTLEKSAEIIAETVNRIKSGEVDPGRITKSVLVIDEAQDMDAHEFALVQALMERNEEMRVIAVGDDDQNIYEFRGASSKYLEQLITEYRAARYELVENYRSKSNLVDFTNRYVQRLPRRLKTTPIIPVQGSQGKLRVVHYRSSNLIVPLVEDVLSQQLPGTTCVLTKTNEEAMQVAGLLNKNGVQAKLIQSNEGFNLYNLLEIRFFVSRFHDAATYVINDGLWSGAINSLKSRFSSSPNLELCLNLIRDFDITNPTHKYKSDLEVFIRESKLEDFVGGDRETVFVSTIHKAKGREFDNVFLMLDQFYLNTAEAMRQLYVAMTRAKNNLMIHYNGDYLHSIKTEGLERVEDFKEYEQPDQLMKQLSLRDVYLDYFEERRHLIRYLKSGDELLVDEDGCLNIKGMPVLKFSNKFKNELQALRQGNYRPQKARVRFMVYWQKTDNEEEIPVILPELYFERKFQE